jgi:predicted XRE-type DNA-binding protein
VKAQLVEHIKTVMTRKGLNQSQLGEEVGLSQPKVSQLMAGSTDGFSVDRLVQILARLGYSVTVGIGTTGAAPTLESQLYQSLFCAGMSTIDENDALSRSPKYVQVVLTHKQLRRLTRHFQHLLNSYGQDIDAVKLEMTKTVNGEDQFDLHDINASVYTSSKFSLYGVPHLDVDDE